MLSFMTDHLKARSKGSSHRSQGMRAIAPPHRLSAQTLSETVRQTDPRDRRQTLAANVWSMLTDPEPDRLPAPEPWDWLDEGVVTVG